MGGKGSGGYHPPKKEPGTNTRILMAVLEGYKKPKVDTKDPQAIAERIEEYLQFCAENDFAPGVANCANWLGIHIDTLRSWYTGNKGTPEHQRIAANFYGVMQSVWEADMHGGNINPVSGIFIGKAFYGYKDTQEIVVKQDGATNALSDSELIERSRKLPGAERLLSSGETPTIDVDAVVIENDPGYNKAVERYERIEKRKAAVEANKPIRKAKKKEYLKGYFQEHKEEYNERHRQYRAAERAKKEAQKAAEQAQKAEKESQKEE